MVAKGHNADHIYLPQVNMALAFDHDQYRLVFLKPLEGSVRDAKSLRNVLDDIHFDGILVLDTGLSSQDLAEIMRSDMKFVMPLCRNHDMIYYSIFVLIRAADLTGKLSVKDKNTVEMYLIKHIPQ